MARPAAKLGILQSFLAFGLTSVLVSTPVHADDGTDLKKLLERVENLEKQNRELKEQLSTVPDTKAEQTGALLQQVQQLQSRLELLEREKQTSKPPPPARTIPLVPAPPQTVKAVVDDYLKELDTKKKLQGDQQKANQEAEGFEVGKLLGANATFSATGGGLQFESADKAWRFHLGGRVDFDNVWYQLPSNLAFGNSDDAKLRDGADFRRLRLRADGQMSENVDYVVEVNFANLQDFGNDSTSAKLGSVGITDVWMQFHEVPFLGNLRVGHIQPPYSLEHMTSTLNWYYMERSPGYDAFTNHFDYVDGATAYRTFFNDRATLAGAYYRSGSSSVNPFGDSAGNGEYGGSVRATALPVYKDEGRTLVHLGVGFTHRALDDRRSNAGDRPLVRGGATSQENPNVMQTGTVISPSGMNYLDPEIAIILGRFSLSSEYMWIYSPQVYQQAPVPGVPFDRGRFSNNAFYAETGYFLTKGDSRRYNRTFGIWDRTVPRENAFLARNDRGGFTPGRGAVQLLARFTYLGLLSGNPTPSPSVGARAGQENDLTLGINWYFNANTYMMINYVNTWVDSIYPGLSGRFQGLGLRFHYDF